MAAVMMTPRATRRGVRHRRQRIEAGLRAVDQRVCSSSGCVLAVAADWWGVIRGFDMMMVMMVGIEGADRARSIRCLRVKRAVR
jgi:hypothetical protein